jgi:hypothetical protein
MMTTRWSNVVLRLTGSSGGDDNGSREGEVATTHRDGG